MDALIVAAPADESDPGHEPDPTRRPDQAAAGPVVVPVAAGQSA